MQATWEFYGLVIALVIGLCVWALKNRSPQDLTDYQDSPSTRTIATQPSQKRDRSASAPQVIQLTMCTECEATIRADEAVCTHCGTPQPICSVCQHPIKHGESILICPHCNCQAHRVHILEYLKVKGTCPNCEEDLDEYELLEPDGHPGD